MLQAGCMCKSGLLAYGLEEGRALRGSSAPHFFRGYGGALTFGRAFYGGPRTFARSLFADGKDWMVQLSVEGAQMDAWISRSGGHCRWVSGGPLQALFWQKLASKINRQPSGAPLSGELDGLPPSQCWLQIRISGSCSTGRQT